MRSFTEKENQARLYIEDPNNPSNNISSATRKMPLIKQTFADAFQVLKDRIDFTGTMEWSGTSILGSIIAANYDTYAKKRQQLRELFERNPRFTAYHQPPPLSSPGAGNHYDTYAQQRQQLRQPSETNPRLATYQPPSPPLDYFPAAPPSESAKKKSKTVKLEI